MRSRIRNRRAQDALTATRERVASLHFPGASAYLDVITVREGDRETVELVERCPVTLRARPYRTGLRLDAAGEVAQAVFAWRDERAKAAA